MAGTSLDFEDIRRRVLKFHQESRSHPHHRYRSWEHCFRFFRDRERIRRDGSKGLDGAALHIGFFLASWGMYRGSTLLLQRDCKIHTEPMRKILDPEYDSLLDVNFSDQLETAKKSAKVIGLAEDLRTTYGRFADEGDKSVTDTLVTKILLGTLGCSPAFDTNVVSGLRKKGISYSKLSQEKLQSIWDVYARNADKFRRVHLQLDEEDHLYTPMKLVDMYFWMVGRPRKIRKLEAGA
jgi:hypothetical protein